MPKETLLVVDDEEDLLELIGYNLKKEGYNVILSENGEDGIAKAKEHHPDLILLDVMMPGINGIDVCREIKQNPDLKHIPVVFLTAKMDEKLEVTGLDLGADDYLSKPVSTAKLKSRVKAVLRRYRNTDRPDNVLDVHDLMIDRERYVVIRGEEELHLPRKEFELLYFLASRKGKVLDRQTLLNEVWGNNVYVIDRTVDVHIRKIREKLGDEIIETVKGVGYRFRQ